MPTYVYKAIAENGETISGECVAASPEALRTELSRNGLLVRKVHAKKIGWGLGRKRIKPVSLLLFNQELMSLVRAGLNIPEALKLAANQPDSPSLGAILEDVSRKVQGGASFSEACASHPSVFDRLFISAIKTGEKTGEMLKPMEKYHVYLEQKIELQKKISHALVYPAFMLLVLVAILGFLFAFVMPRFVSLYSDFGTDLPAPTRILIGFAENLPFYLLLVFAAGFAAWLGLRLLSTSESGRIWIDRFKMRLPVLGSIQQSIVIAQLSRMLSALLSTGTSLVEAMKSTAHALPNRACAYRLDQTTTLVSEGNSLAQAMRKTRLLPLAALKMIEVGEASGTLGDMFASIAEFHEEKVDSKLTKLITLVEPTLILTMGIFIGAIIIIMYLPIIHVVDIVR